MNPGNNSRADRNMVMVRDMDPNQDQVISGKLSLLTKSEGRVRNDPAFPC